MYDNVDPSVPLVEVIVKDTPSTIEKLKNPGFTGVIKLKKIVSPVFTESVKTVVVVPVNVTVPRTKELSINPKSSLMTSTITLSQFSI